MMNAISSILGSGFSWIANNKLALLIGVLIFLVLFFLVILPICRKIKSKYQKTQETKTLKQDLQIWDNLASLVRGGQEGKEARNNLSADLNLITALFKQGIKLIYTSRRKIYEMPWYVIVGEPQSGKSALLENSEAGFHCSNSERMEIPGRETALPLRCWLNSKAFVLDVSGKVFFDRWLEDSSAEWTHFLHLLVRRHKKKPLNGILLAIPADALLTDKPQLMRQKLDLIAAELQQLLLYTGQQLYCQIIVTKLDMLPGFREYFSGANNELRHSVCGWANRNEQGRYKKGDLNPYFEQMHDVLSDAVGAKLMSKEIFQIEEDSMRMNAAGNVYCFPESFCALQDQLDTYLDTLFGDMNWHGSKHLKLSGVCFTSSRDQGITFSPKFAELAGKELEQAPIVTSEQPGNAFFSTNLFLDGILHIPEASFIPKKQVRMDLPNYLVCLGLVIIATIWITAPLTKEIILRSSLDPIMHYFFGLEKKIMQASLSKSPLIGFDEATKRPVLLDEQPMTGSTNTSRIDFYYTVLESTKQKIQVPFGFKTSSFLLSYWNKTASGNPRRRIFNTAQRQMVLIPLLNTFQKYTLNSKEESFTIAKRDAMSEFLCMTAKEYDTPDELTKALMLYLFPDLGDRIADFLPQQPCNSHEFEQLRAEWLYQPEYSQTIKKLVHEFVAAWNKKAMYPDSTYQRCRTIILSADELQKTHAKVAALAAKKNHTQADLAEWRNLLIQEDQAITRMIQMKRKITATETLEPPPPTGKNKSEDIKKVHQYFLDHFLMLLQKAGKEQVQMLRQDLNLDEEYMAHLMSIISTDKKFSSLSLSNNQRTEFEAQIIQVYKQEIETLYTLVNSSMTSSIYEPVEVKTGKSADFVPGSERYGLNVLQRLLQELISLEPPQKLKDASEFYAAWRNLTESETHINQELDKIKEMYENPILQACVADGKQYVALQSENWKKQLAEQELELYPKSVGELMKKTQQVVAKQPELQLPKELMAESIGELKIQPEFLPDMAEQVFSPILVLLSIKTEEGQPSYLSQCKNGDAVLRVCQGYLTEYLDYWGNFAEQLKCNKKNWKEFRQYCAMLKPYEVNILLQQIYSYSIANLNRPRDGILSKELQKKRSDYITAIENRRQTLTPHFSQICVTQLAAWASLPESALDAFRAVSAMPEKQLKSEFLAVVAVGNKCDIPWWDNLFRTGAQCMKADAGEALVAPINSQKDSLLRFPLCADSLDAQPMTEKELAKVQTLLQNIGFKTPENADTTVAGDKGKEQAPSADPAVSFVNLGLADKFDANTREWGANLQIITDALLNPMKELVWTLSIPETTSQNKWMSEAWRAYPDATIRYRYWEIKCNQKKIGKRAGTATAASFLSSELAGDLALCFYSFSGDTEPTAVVHIPGPWAILRLYLTQGAVYDAEKGNIHVPLLVSDKLGQPSLLWLTLGFNKKLPLPKQWPSIGNWPEFSKIQTEEIRKRAVTDTDWKALFLSAKDYHDLYAKLQGYDRGKYPALEVSLADSAALYPKYRYLEMQVQGVKSERIQIEQGTKLLGTVPLQASEIRFLFYQHSIQKQPGFSVCIPGPYAPLRLLTANGRRKENKKGISLIWKAEDGNEIPLLLNLKTTK